MEPSSSQRPVVVSIDDDAVAAVSSASDPVSDDPIALNVGGREFMTTRRTLCQVPGTVLAHVFGGRFAAPRIDRQGRPFIDRDPQWFGLILNYLRDVDLPALPTAANDLASLRCETRFYGLDQLTAAIESRFARCTLCQISVLDCEREPVCVRARPVFQPFNAIVVDTIGKDLDVVVMDERPTAWFVHYMDYSNKWDEWVDKLSKRIKQLNRSTPLKACSGRICDCTAKVVAHQDDAVGGGTGHSFTGSGRKLQWPVLSS